MNLPWIIAFVIATIVAIVVSIIMLISLRRAEKQFKRIKKEHEEPFEEFLDTVSMTLITPGHGFTQEDYDKVDQLYLHLTDVPIGELAEILSNEPEVIEKQIDALNHILNCIDGTWDKEGGGE